MRRSTIALGSLLLAGIIASAASPAGAQSAPRPLSLGDLQGFGIRSGNPDQPQRPLPTAAVPAVEPATVEVPAVEPAQATESVVDVAPSPIVDAAAPTVLDEDVLPGIIIRAKPAPPAAGTTTAPVPAPQAKPAAIAALAPTPGEARAAAQTTALPQQRPTPLPAAHAPPQPKPEPAAILPTVRPPLAERGPASLNADALQSIALKPVATVRVAPATVEPTPAVTDVQRRSATTVIVAPTAPPTPAATPLETPTGAAAAAVEPLTPPATRPIQLDTDALVAVGLRSGGGVAPERATPAR